MDKILKFGIDVGSSTLKMVSLYESGRLQSCDFITALADGLSQNQIINQEAISRLIEAFDEAFKIINQHPQATIKTVATEAFRQAKNSREICALLKQRYKIDCVILSQEQEAELTFKGASAYALSKIECLIDIGGASTEINTINRQYLFQEGLLSLINKYGEDTNTLQQAALKIFAFNAPKIRAAHCSSKSLIYALSAPANINNFDIDEYAFAGKLVNKSQLRDLIEFCKSHNPTKLFRLFDARNPEHTGASSSRAKAICCACAILLALPFESYIITPHALKEGLLV